MATAASVTTDLTTCPICLEVFANPKSLPCLHAFCLKCLQRHFKDKCLGDEVPCPLCRKEFEIPSDGLSGLQHHFFIQQLVDARKAVSEESIEVSCEVCSEDNDEDSEKIPTATTFCVDCNQKLCERCSKPHRKWRGGAHQVRILGAELEEELVQLRGSNCDKHKDKQVELYCYDCNENICVLCFAVKHTQHQTAEIREAAKTFSFQINCDNEQIWSEVRNVQEKSKEKQKKRNEFLREVDKAKYVIKEAGNEVSRIVDNQVAVELSEVDMIKSEDEKKAETVEERYQLALVAMESFCAYSRELLDKGRPSDVTRSAVELHKRATELLNNDVTFVQYRPPHVTFTPADVTQVKRLNLIGKVTVATEKHTGMHIIVFCSCTVPFSYVAKQDYLCTIRYDSKSLTWTRKLAEYSALSSTRSQKKKLKQTTPVAL